jgi:phosphate transport system protein
MDMAKLSESCVFNAIESYKSGTPIKNQIFEWSEKLRVLQEEVADLAIELIARYQPVATDLRFIRSSMEIAYGFSRYGRYSYDIADLLEIIGSVADCDKSAVLEVEDTVRQMILLSVSLLTSRNKDAVQRLYQMDDTVDALYRKYLRETVSLQPDAEKNIQPSCYVSALLILRYLERIADHACYIGDSVYYITTGRSSPRR